MLPESSDIPNINYLRNLKILVVLGAFFCFQFSFTQQPDTDGDSVEDHTDLDDDNDSILDTAEGCEKHRYFQYDRFREQRHQYHIT